MRTKRFLSLCGLALCLMMWWSPFQALAWGERGHRLVARVAASRLTPKTAKAVKKLLGRDQTLDSVSTYADLVRSSRPETIQWHFVDIPRNADGYDSKRDCQPTDHGDCIIAVTERLIATLSDTRKSKAERAEALKFLVHFLGDMHQPLHCADDHDAGGNAVQVEFLGTPFNLHAVWDSGMIESQGLSEDEYLAKLTKALASQDVPTIEQGTITNWGNESHRAAVEHAYLIPPNHVLNEDYVKANLPVMDVQLAKGGIRLAKVLNRIFDPPAQRVQSSSFSLHPLFPKQPLEKNTTS